MSWSLAFFTFLNAWWVSLFIALPMSIETAENPDRLDYAAAPKRIKWRRIVLIATVIAAIFTVALALIIKSGIIPLRGTL